jgi:hypothetical protein
MVTHLFTLLAPQKFAFIKNLFNSRRIQRYTAACLMAFALLAPSAYAAVVLQIDIADPKAIKFIATEANSQINDASYDVSLGGITLVDALAEDSILTSGYLVAVIAEGDLRNSGVGALPYNGIGTRIDVFGYPRSFGLFYFAPGTNGLQSFATDTRAFSGQTVAPADFMNIFLLKPVGTTGDVVAGGDCSEGCKVSGVIGQWEIINSAENAGQSTAALEGARAACGVQNSPMVATGEQAASCSLLGGNVKVESDLHNAAVKVYAAAPAGGFENGMDAAASAADLITVVEGWDADGVASGTFELDVHGMIDVSDPGNKSHLYFYIARWYPTDPNPRCIYNYNSVDMPECNGFPYEGPYDYAKIDFEAFDGNLDISTFADADATGSVTIQSGNASDLRATLSIPWTVTRDNPSFYVAVLGFASQPPHIPSLADFYNTANVSFTGPAGFQFSGKKGLAAYLPASRPWDSPVDLNGSIKTAEDQDICAIVIASGKHMFSCDPGSSYVLTDLPREGEWDASVSRHVYADGFFPKVEKVYGSVFEKVVLEPAYCPKFNPPTHPGVNPGSANKEVTISGKVLVHDSQTPVCAMVLANGSYMFSCDGNGSYALTFPLDANGQYTLQVYADGFAPVALTYDEFATPGTVQMTRSAECE